MREVNVRRWRKAVGEASKNTGLSVQELGLAAGFCRTYLYDRKTTTDPHLSMIKFISQKSGCSVDWMLGLSDEEMR